MFLSPDGKTYEPYKIRSQKKEPVVTNGEDTSMGGVDKDKEEEEELIEDPEDEEGAIYPLKGNPLFLLSCRTIYFMLTDWYRGSD